MTEKEIRDMATDTYELGVKMSTVFRQTEFDKDFFILAIAACITGVVKERETRYSLNPIVNLTGEYFFKLRKEKGYTLRQTEDATGISNSYLSQFETGKILKPSHDVITKLLNWYNDGVTIDKSEHISNLNK